MQTWTLDSSDKVKVNWQGLLLRGLLLYYVLYSVNMYRGMYNVVVKVRQPSVMEGWRR